MVSTKDLHDYVTFFETDFIAQSDPAKYKWGRNLVPIGANSKMKCAVSNKMQAKKDLLNTNIPENHCKNTPEVIHLISVGLQV